MLQQKIKLIFPSDLIVTKIISFFKKLIKKLEFNKNLIFFRFTNLIKLKNKKFTKKYSNIGKSSENAGGLFDHAF